MKISLRLAEQLGAAAERHGVLTEIEHICGVERHTVASWLNNTARYVNLDALGRVADYLVKRHGVDRGQLPGALLGRDPEYFWDALASCKKLQFCLGTRTTPQWTGSDYVMSCDALLQGRMLTEISNRVCRMDGATEAESPAHRAIAESTGNGHRVVHSFFPEFHLVRGPNRRLTAENADDDDDWHKSKKDAIKLYDRFRAQPSSALIALASIKVNPIVEIMLAKTFSAEPFVTEDGVAKPKDRKCPILFRYREKKDERWEADPQPPSCCGGVQLAAKTPAPRSGIYYQTRTGRWEAACWELASDDVAFFFYAYRPSKAQVEVACGGFSARATRKLTQNLEDVTAQMGKPQFESESLHVGLYLIAFTFDPSDTNYTPDRDDRECQFQVIPLDDKALGDRLKQKRAARRRSTARRRTSLRKR